MEPEKNDVHQWLNNSALFAYLAAGIYLIAYFFQVGYLTYYRISPTFIETSINNISISFTFIIPVLIFTITKFIYLFAPIELISRIISKQKKLFIIFKFLILYIWVLALLVLIPYHYSLINVQIAIFNIAIILITLSLHYYQYRKNKSPLIGGSIITQLWKKCGTTIIVITVYISFLAVSCFAGIQLARRQTVFQTFGENQRYAIIYMTSKYAIAMPIGARDNMLGFEYRIFPLESINSPILTQDLGTSIVPK